MSGSEELENGREEALATLQDHFAHDRLSLEDFEQRTDGVERAESLEAIDALLSDLPQFDAEGRRVITPYPEDEAQGDARGAAEAAQALATMSRRELARAGEAPPVGETALATSSQSRALVPSTPPTRALTAVFSSTKRKGQWRVAQQVKVRSVFGDAKIDFREAILLPGTTEVIVSAVFGSTKIVVPPDLPVVSDGFAVLGDFSDHHQDPDDVPEDVPRLLVRGKAVFGSVEVVVKSIERDNKRWWQFWR